MRFEWDARKGAANLRKHGVSFEEAATALRDPLAATVVDPDHSLMERRFLTFGVSVHGRLLVVAHMEQEEEQEGEQESVLRIISARLTTSSERAIYEEA